MDHFNLYNSIGTVLSLVFSFIIVFTSIPTIVEVARAKRLYDEPGKRKLHTSKIPTLGGVAIFSAVILSLTLFTSFSIHPEFQYIIASSVLLFFVGIKDDILIIAPLKKLGGQVFAVLIVIFLGDLRFTSLHGFLGITHLPYFLSVFLTIFVFVVIINGLNLIDGIDGLASGVGILVSSVLSVYFGIAGEYGYAIMGAAMAGSLLSFFIFNVFGKEYKIFMGDTGSLIIGFFIAVMAVKFNEMNVFNTGSYFIHAAPAVSFGILIVPLFDTMRVFVIRIAKGVSPFSADKNHVHHKILAMGYTHLQATLIILFVNAIIISMVFYLNYWGIIDLMLLILSTAIFFSILPDIIYFIKQKKNQILNL